MTYSVGDRFRRTMQRSDWGTNSIWEITRIDHGYYDCICIEGPRVKDNQLFLLKTGWQYLGNFNKSNNFSNLWDILNG